MNNSTIDLYNLTVKWYRKHQDAYLFNDISDSFTTNVPVIVLIMEHTIKENIMLRKMGQDVNLNISKLLKEKLRDFNINIRFFDKETKEFYRSILSGLNRRKKNWTSVHPDFYKIRRLKTNKKRYSYYYVDMIVQTQRIIEESLWHIVDPNDISMKGNVGGILEHYLVSKFIERHKLTHLFIDSYHAAWSILYDLRDMKLGGCWKMRYA